MMINRKIIITSSLLGCFLLYCFVIIPWFDILELKGSYLAIVKNEVVMTDKKPASWTRLNQVEKSVVQTIVISEDWAFYHHMGIDYRQIYHSIKDSITGKSLRGASTISQQLVKNVYFSNRRSYFRKFYELFYTIMMEIHLSKNEILEKYLNIIELGQDIYGIREGALEYFNSSPSDLNTRQGAFLAMLLPSPKKYSESFRQKELTDYAQKTINRILDKMVVGRFLSEEDRDYYKKLRFSWESNVESYEILEEDYMEYE